jgi:hypothetical protein
MDNFDLHDSLWHILQQCLANKNAAKENWQKLLSTLPTHVNSTVYAELASIKNIDQDVADIKAWFIQQLQAAKKLSSTKAIWIRLAQFTDEQAQQEVYAINAIGSNAYDEENNFWNKQKIWEQENAWLLPDTLGEIKNIIEQDEEHAEILDWILPLSLICFMFNEINPSLSEYLPNGVAIIETTIGYDNGDYIGVHPIGKYKE